jgi:DNA-binding LacI/PurR family transcriptional regulator
VSVLSGIHDAFSKADFLPITVWTGNLDKMPHFEEGDTEGKKQINRLLDRRVDGLIMWPPFSLAYYHHFPEFVERRVPVAVIDHYSTVADSVETDEEQATEMVAEHLLSLGHRRIACLSSRETPTQTWAIKRRSSFEAAVAKCRGACVASWHLNEQGSNAVEMARELLLSELAPTAVFAVTDHEANAVYRAADELGRSVPGDLSVVGFADLDFAATMDPPLTTMRQKPYEIGRLAAELIMDRITGEVEDDGEPTTIKVDAELIVRKSTAPPPQG